MCWRFSHKHDEMEYIFEHENGKMGEGSSHPPILSSKMKIIVRDLPHNETTHEITRKREMEEMKKKNK